MNTMMRPSCLLPGKATLRSYSSITHRRRSLFLRLQDKRNRSNQPSLSPLPSPLPPPPPSSTMQGPCLPHCYRPCGPLTVGTARAAMAYVGACIVYLLLTRRLDRPLHDSLTPAQLSIKRESARVRSQIFCIGVAVSLASIYVLRPLQAVSPGGLDARA